MTRLIPFAIAVLLGTSNSAHAQSISAPSEPVKAAPFDIVSTAVRSEGAEVVFTLRVRADAGELRPKATGAFAGSAVFSYVWPTSLDSATVGFAESQGILALAVTFHPDFDDAAGGGVNRLGWHPHWIVLTPDPVCGAGALKVKDIPAGTTPRLPETWPGVPLLIAARPIRPSWAATRLRSAYPRASLARPKGCASTA